MYELIYLINLFKLINYYFVFLNCIIMFIFTTPLLFAYMILIHVC